MPQYVSSGDNICWIFHLLQNPYHRLLFLKSGVVSRSGNVNCPIYKYNPQSISELESKVMRVMVKVNHNYAKMLLKCSTKELISVESQKVAIC